MDSFRSTCLISTVDTLMPQASVWVSSVLWMSRLSFSRYASSASSSCFPSTARSVVWASWLVASRKLTTWMIAFCGSTTRKYTTAFTLTETLSRVITSCGGTSSTTVRRSPHHLLDRRNEHDQPRPLHHPEAPELQHHATLVLAQDA